MSMAELSMILPGPAHLQAATSRLEALQFRKLPSSERCTEAAAISVLADQQRLQRCAPLCRLFAAACQTVPSWRAEVFDELGGRVERGKPLLLST